VVWTKPTKSKIQTESNQKSIQPCLIQFETKPNRPKSS